MKHKTPFLILGVTGVGLMAGALEKWSSDTSAALSGVLGGVIMFAIPLLGWHRSRTKVRR